MLIDLFTVIAQIINFIILVFLLKKFLFNKIISIMDERESQISEQLANAEQKENDAREEAEKQQKIREKLEQEWDESLARIKHELQLKREEMMKKARESVDQAEKNWRNSLTKQHSAFLRELRQLSCHQVCQVSKKVLADLANEKLENQLIRSFLNQLEDLKDNKEQNFRLSDLKGEKEVEIHTAFKLRKEDKDLIAEKIKDLARKQVVVVFKESGDLICGIELKSEGKKISWSIESYLDALEKSLKEVLEEDEIKGEITIKENNEIEEQ